MKPRHKAPGNHRVRRSHAYPGSGPLPPGSGEASAPGGWNRGEAGARGYTEPADSSATGSASASASPRRSATDGDRAQDPREHTRKIKRWMKELIDHLRSDVQKVHDPKTQALFETSAEVLGGLIKAFEDYEKKNEQAWK